MRKNNCLLGTCQALALKPDGAAGICSFIRDRPNYSAIHRHYCLSSRHGVVRGKEIGERRGWRVRMQPAWCSGKTYCTTGMCTSRFLFF